MKIIDITKGLSGIIAVQLTTFVPTPDQVLEIGKFTIQVIIAVCTIVAMFKKKKKR
jgi:hypothetical protein